MRRSKVNAMTFLAGALLVGGITGAAGNAWYAGFGKQHRPYRSASERMFDDLGVSCEQRQRMEVLLRGTDSLVRAANAPLRARADSVLAPAQARANAILEPAQRIADSIRAPMRRVADSIRTARWAEVRGVLTEKQRARYDQYVAAAERQSAEWEAKHPEGANRAAEPCPGAIRSLPGMPGDRGRGPRPMGERRQGARDSMIRPKSH